MCVTPNPCKFFSSQIDEKYTNFSLLCVYDEIINNTKVPP